MKTTLSILICIWFAAPSWACELLVKAQNPETSTIGAAKDQAGRTRRGMIVVIKPDGWRWGSGEALPMFVVIKIPGISVERASKYIEASQEWSRVWRLRWDDLPAEAKTKLAAGGLVIKATDAYTGPYDYTWAQVRSYFSNAVTQVNETSDL